MREPSLEVLFERYRGAGDLAAMAVVFDRTAPGLLALAAHLVRDPVEAEDLVQATFVVVLEHARAFDAERRLEPWLAGILVRHARRAQRERSRHTDPARLERAPVPEPPAELERHELAAALRGALEDLDEPYRTVLERHLRGERALDIARASGRAPGTIRMQILRGLERLRRLLPAGLYALVPVRTPRGLDAIRAQVLQGASPAAAAVGSAVTLGWIGGLAVTTKAVCIVAAAVMVALVFQLRAGRQPAPAEESVARAAVVPTLSTPADADPPPSASGGRVRVDEPTPPMDSTRETRAPGIAKLEPERVWLAGPLLGRFSAPEAARLTVVAENGLITDGRGAPDGTYAIEITPLLRGQQNIPPAVTLLVTGIHPSGQKAQVELHVAELEVTTTPEGEGRIELPLSFAPVTSVVGRVTGPELDIASAQLLLLPLEGGALSSVTGGDCDGDGRFALFPERSGRLRLVVAASQVLPCVLEVDVVEGVATDVGEVVLDQQGVALEGQVVSGVERLARHAYEFGVRARRILPLTAHAHDVSESVRLLPSGPAVLQSSARLHADGSFRIEGLDPGTYSLELDRGDSGCLVPPFPALEVVAPASGIVFGEEYGLVRATLTGVPPGASAHVSVVVGSGLVPSRETRGDPVVAIVDRRAAAKFVATAPGRRATRVESPACTRAPEEEITLAFESGEEPAALELSWDLPEGVPEPANVRVVWCGSGGGGDKTVDADAHGCRVRGLAPGRVRAVLEPERLTLDARTGGPCVVPFEVEIVPERTARVHVEWTSGGQVRFVPDTGGRSIESRSARVLDSAGLELPVSFTRRELRADGASVSVWQNSIPLFQPCHLEPSLPAGAYVLVLSEDRAECARVPFTIVAGEVVDVPFVVP